MTTPIFQLLDLSALSGETMETILLLKKKGLVQAVKDEDTVIVARYNVNITTLKRVLKQRKVFGN